MLGAVEVLRWFKNLLQATFLSFNFIPTSLSHLDTNLEIFQQMKSSHISQREM